MITPEQKTELADLLAGASDGLAEAVQAALALQDVLDNPPESRVFPLSKAVEFAGVAYNSVSLREPTVGEMELVDKSKAPPIAAVALIGGIPEGAVKLLPARAFNAMKEYLLYFFTASDRPTL